jgi:GT2 family glycosyltransferase
MPKASVIIVTLDGGRRLEPLLGGLFDQGTDDIELDVLVVDNTATGGCKKFLEQKFPDARILELRENYGFAPAVNLGAKASDGEFVVLLNDDCHVRENWLTELIKTFDENPSVACTGSLILNDKGEKIDFQTGTANIFGWGFHMDKGEPLSSVRNEPFRAFFACGAACAFRRDAFEDAGMLMEETFAFFEDVEIGWRLNALGYEVWINPASVVQHRHGETVKRFGSGFHPFLTERNALLNAWCNLSPDESDLIISIALSLSALRLTAKAGSTTASVLGKDGLEAIFAFRKDDVYKPPTAESVKNIAKRRRFGRDADWAPVEAVADFGCLLPRLRERRDSLQAKRKRATSELLQLMGEPFRPVIGHPREKAFIEKMEPIIREALGWVE